jgi:Uma2 family endonuclease
MFAREHRLGAAGTEIGFVLQRNPDVVLAPDVAFVTTERLPGGALPEGFVEGAPTLAVEVVSPNDRDSEVNEKVGEYLAHATERVWVVRPRSKTVTVFHPDNTARIYHIGDALTSDDAGFPADGFALPLDELFG